MFLLHKDVRRILEDRSEQNLIKFQGAEITGFNFENMDLSCMNFKGARLQSVNFTNCKLASCNFSSSQLDTVNFSGADLTSANFSLACLYTVTFISTQLQLCNFYDAIFRRNCILTHAKLYGANFFRAFISETNLRNATCFPPTILSAHWEELSDELTALAMAYDASFHPNLNTFNEWAKGGPCPYNNVNISRACHFYEKRKCWNPDIKPPRPYDLMVALIKEKCLDSDWHDKPVSAL